MRKPTDQYSHCNHYHELTDGHSIVDFGNGEFVANNDAIPLLKALNDLGIKTRSHHIDGRDGWFSILLENVSYKEQMVAETDRTEYNGQRELMVFFGEYKSLGKNKVE